MIVRDDTGPSSEDSLGSRPVSATAVGLWPVLIVRPVVLRKVLVPIDGGSGALAAGPFA